ncbi:G0/G1 switch protein 2 [Eucyclogobius newberryi]|uniref:G0/G1 switch protein 2 n=1 Tax=Eucyclogobius newberryi TaxID=166745 RepID=UPI003B5CCA36
METQDEGVVPFVREMLRQRPTRHMIKIYAIGSTLAALGAVVGLMQWVFRPEEPEEEEAAGPTGESARRAEASARGPKIIISFECAKEEIHKRLQVTVLTAGQWISCYKSVQIIATFRPIIS